MRTVAVTGAEGQIGRGLVRLLESDESFDRVVQVEESLLASAEVKRPLEGVDVVVHLPQHPSPEALRRLLDAAGAVGARGIVHLSHAMVYGAWPDNPVPLTEDAVVRPNPGFAFAVAHAEAERLVGEWRSDHPGTTVAVLRPVPVLDPSDRSWLQQLWRGAPPVRVAEAAPPVQFVHHDDVAAAAHLAAALPLDGTFNVAPDGWVTAEEALALAGGATRPAFPERLGRRVLEVGGRAGFTETPPEALPYLAHPWVVANDRLRAAGWAPTHSNEEAFVAGHELPGWRAALSRHRQHLALAGGGALVGVSAAVTAFVRARRRR